MPDTAARNARNVRWGEAQGRKGGGGLYKMPRRALEHKAG